MVSTQKENPIGIDPVSKLTKKKSEWYLWDLNLVHKVKCLDTDHFESVKQHLFKVMHRHIFEKKN